MDIPALRIHIIIRNRTDSDFFPAKFLFQFPIAHGCMEFQNEMQSGILFNNPALLLREYLPDQSQNLFSFPLIVQTHSIDMFLKISPGDKFCQRILFKGRNRTGIEIQIPVKQIRQRLSYN